MEKYTVEQLKAMAYDEVVRLEQAQKNLQILNQEIAKRLEDKPKKK